MILNWEFYKGKTYLALIYYVQHITPKLFMLIYNIVVIVTLLFLIRLMYSNYIFFCVAYYWADFCRLSGMILQ